MKSDNTLYEGRRLGENEASEVEVKVDGKTLDLHKSLKVRSHSPCGFNWGYSGSGPAQLSLAILLDFCGEADDVIPLYQEFKFRNVAGWGTAWKITGKEIREWVEGQKKPKEQ